MKPDVAHITELKRTTFELSGQILENLKQELPNYLAKYDNFSCGN